MRPRKERSKRARALRLWSWNEVTKAAPYLHSVIGSLREHWLEVLAAERRVDRSSRHKAPLKRAQIILNNIWQATAPPMPAVVRMQPVAHRKIRGSLHGNIQSGVNTEPALVHCFGDTPQPTALPESAQAEAARSA